MRASRDLHRPLASGETVSRTSARRSLLLTLAATVALGSLVGLTACQPSGSDDGGVRIAVIPKGTTHEFWKMIHAGAVKAEREINAGTGPKVEVIWKGPQKEDDRSQQIQVVQNFIARRVKGICLAPLDDKALLAPVQTATRAGIRGRYIS